MQCGFPSETSTLVEVLPRRSRSHSLSDICVTVHQANKHYHIEKEFGTQKRFSTISEPFCCNRW
uniref:Uncharacterized protein n=1 Tax=Parascaris equorum TaxID=6256 RepID=A0A914RJT0_PAREQ